MISNQSIDLIETYAYRMSKDLICKKEKINRDNIIRQYQNFQSWLDGKENIREHNPKWQEIADHLYQILIIGGSGSGKANALLNLIKNEPNNDGIYLYPKDPYEAKY